MNPQSPEGEGPASGGSPAEGESADVGAHRQPGGPADDPAPAAPDPRDRRKGDRRSGIDRRAGTEPPAGVERRAGDRRGPDRRASPGVPGLYRGGERHMNEYPLLADELEFINVINLYRQRHGRPFPTWSEVLHVLKFLGYTKPAPAAPDGDPKDAGASAEGLGNS